MSTRSAPRQDGFTLIELLVSTVISLALGVGGFMFLRGQLKSLTNQAAGLDAIEAARASLDFMANDIRMTGSNAVGSTRWIGTNTCTGTSTSFTAVWDDGLSANGTAPNHTVQYSYDSANKRILRTVGGTSTELIKNVPAGGLSFQYLLSNGSAAPMSGGQVSSCDSVAVVQVTVIVTAARAAETYTVNLGSRVTLRNRSSVLSRM